MIGREREREREREKERKKEREKERDYSQKNNDMTRKGRKTLRNYLSLRKIVWKQHKKRQIIDYQKRFDRER